MNLYLFNTTDSAATYGIGTYLKELPHAIERANIRIHIVHLQSTRPEFCISTFRQGSMTGTGSMTNISTGSMTGTVGSMTDISTGSMTGTGTMTGIENWYIPDVQNRNMLIGSKQAMDIYYRNVIFLLRLYITDTTELVFHFNYNLFHSLAKGLKEFFNCKTVTTIHFIIWQLEMQGNLSRFNVLKLKPENQRNTFEKMIYTTYTCENFLLKNVDRIIVLSYFTKNFLTNEYHIEPTKISVIPNGLADIIPISETEKVVLRRKWHLPEKGLLILFVGRLDTVKGLSYLLGAFREVLKVLPDCRLMIAGNGHYDTYIQGNSDICTKTSYAGLLQKNDLYELYQMADIGVMPSFHEQCSYVAIEMMMHGVPLVVSTSTGLNEMVEEGVSGLHIPVMEDENKVEIDTNLLADKMLFLLLNPDERKRMGQNARRRYEEIYSMDVFRRNMLNFYASLLNDQS